MLQYAVGLTMDAAGAAWDKPGSTTLVDSGSDPDAIGSTSYYSQDATAVGTSGSWSADIGGSPTASVYVAVPVNKVDGAGPPAGSGVVETVTGHPHFLLDPFDAVPVGGTFVFIGCVLGTTAPTVTGTAGLTLVPLFDPVTIPGAVIVGWKAVLASSPTPGDQVVIDQTLDSSFAAYFRGN